MLGWSKMGDVYIGLLYQLFFLKLTVIVSWHAHICFLLSYWRLPIVKDDISIKLFIEYHK